MPFTITTDTKYIYLNDESLFNAFIAIGSLLKARGLYIFVKDGSLAFYVMESEFKQLSDEVTAKLTSYLQIQKFQISSITSDKLVTPIYDGMNVVVDQSLIYVGEMDPSFELMLMNLRVDGNLIKRTMITFSEVLLGRIQALAVKRPEFANLVVDVKSHNQALEARIKTRLTFIEKLLLEVIEREQQDRARIESLQNDERNILRTTQVTDFNRPPVINPLALYPGVQGNLERKQRHAQVVSDGERWAHENSRRLSAEAKAQANMLSRLQDDEDVKSRDREDWGSISFGFSSQQSISAVEQRHQRQQDEIARQMQDASALRSEQNEMFSQPTPQQLQLTQLRILKEEIEEYQARLRQAQSEKKELERLQTIEKLNYLILPETALRDLLGRVLQFPIGADNDALIALELAHRNRHQSNISSNITASESDIPSQFTLIFKVFNANGSEQIINMLIKMEVDKFVEELKKINFNPPIGHIEYSIDPSKNTFSIVFQHFRDSIVRFTNLIYMILYKIGLSERFNLLHIDIIDNPVSFKKYLEEITAKNATDKKQNDDIKIPFKYMRKISFLVSGQGNNYLTEEKVWDISKEVCQSLDCLIYKMTFENYFEPFGKITNTKITIIVLSKDNKDNYLEERQKVFHTLNSMTTRFQIQRIPFENISLLYAPIVTSGEYLLGILPINVRREYNEAGYCKKIIYRFCFSATDAPSSEQSPLPQAIKVTFAIPENSLGLVKISKDPEVLSESNGTLYAATQTYYGVQKNNFWQKREGKPDYKVKHTFFRDEAGDANNLFFRLQKAGFQVKSKNLVEGKTELRVNLSVLRNK